MQDDLKKITKVAGCKSGWICHTRGVSQPAYPAKPAD